MLPLEDIRAALSLPGQYLNNMAWLQWKQNCFCGRVANDAMRVCDLIGLFLPVELWLMICRVLVGDAELAKVQRDFSKMRNHMMDYISLSHRLLDDDEDDFDNDEDYDASVEAIESARDDIIIYSSNVYDLLHRGCYLCSRYRRRFEALSKDLYILFELENSEITEFLWTPKINPTL